MRQVGKHGGREGAGHQEEYDKMKDDEEDKVQGPGEIGSSQVMDYLLVISF